MHLINNCIMNVDSPSHSKDLRPCTVTSKYFTGKPGMDESLTDFKEKKTSCTGPKNTEKTKPNQHLKPKKRKRIRGQKDIRTILKKNELISYSNDFEKVCKQSGIDIDPEQLQLAIALSRSVQQSDSCKSEISESLSVQERTGKIRTTLLEYGFKVPEIKITSKRRKLKKDNKNYKLILSTEADKQQVISDKYSQVLLAHLNVAQVTEDINKFNNLSARHLYNLATQVAYEFIKSNNAFYVEDLLEISPNTTGCLLKDWSKIPGRPASPTVCHNTVIKFNEIECSHEELDTILSGTLVSAQEIVKTKHCSLFKENTAHTPVLISDTVKNKTEFDLNMNINHLGIVGVGERKSDPVIVIKDSNSKEAIIDNCKEILDVDAPVLLTVPNKVRCCSPDIFDDDVSSIMDFSKEEDTGTTISTELPIKTIIANDIMDLTECVNVVSQKRLTVSFNTLNDMPSSQQSQGKNITRRRSNDFMEITGCVVSSSKPVIVNNIEANIDLTQKCIEEVFEDNEVIKDKDNVQSIDLTQSTNTDDELPIVEISGKEESSLDDTIILNEDAYIGMNRQKTLISNKVSEDSPIFDKHSKVEQLVVSSTKRSISPIEQDFKGPNPLTIDSEDELDYAVECTKTNTLNETLDFTKKCPAKLQSLEESDRKSKTRSFFEEFVYHHSDDESKENKDESIYKGFDKSTAVTKCNLSNMNDVDLTQSTDSEEVDGSKSPLFMADLGKKGDVSIDYDEIFDEDVPRVSHSKQSGIFSNFAVYDINDDNKETRELAGSSKIDLVSSCSQNSEVFEISDRELDYSLQQSKHEMPIENFHFGGISIMDDLSNMRRSKSTNFDENDFVDTHDLNRSVSDSFLPMVHVEDTNKDFSVKSPVKTHTKLSTPFKATKEAVSVTTPMNGEYLIKTDQVTPMLDYASMSTPDRNQELRKYGLKPFKRKRAIQLLTHLYNQTHPIIESCSSEDLPSPSKKLKSNSENYSQRLVSPKKTTKSPQKRIKTPKKDGETFKSPKKTQKFPRAKAKENREGTNDKFCMYEVTNETPVVRDIECCEEDWVFQKREKAKVHSCRVPLHVAFHNYVSCRRGLRDAILRYEPVNIDDIHGGLLACGYKYHPKDLLKFMDKKCITVKTADNNSRNNKKCN